MFGPKRRAGEKTFKYIDPPITQKTYDGFVKSLEHLKKVVRPRTSKEVMILAEGGDFSENAGYQAAKGKLRGINSKILEIEARIRKAKIIFKPKNCDTVQLGHTVTINLNGRQQMYTILGSTEANPSEKIISHNSPIGSAIMGVRVDETVHVPLKDSIVECTILDIKISDCT